VRLLEEAGYRQVTTTDVWINQKVRRAISSETVGRHTHEWLVRWLRGEIVRDVTSRSAAHRRSSSHGVERSQACLPFVLAAQPSRSASLGLADDLCSPQAVDN